YNTAEFISETLDSVFAQTFTDFEIFVVNDAAPDTSQLIEVLKPYKEKIIFIDKSENEGVCVARNLAALEARGDYIAFVDADDIWFPNYLQEQVEFLEANNYDLVFAVAKLFGVSSQAGKTLLPFNPPRGEVTRSMFIEGRCLILPSGTLVRRRDLLAVGGFDPQVTRTEDFDLYMRMIFRGTRFGCLGKVLFKFRLRPGSGSGDLRQRNERCINVWRILQRKLEFTEEENRIIERHIEKEEAALLRSKGKIYLNQGNWEEAAAAFRQARQKAEKLGLPLVHKLKLSAILMMLSISPGLLRRLFQFIRSSEVEYIPN
ncbi:MAG TPA: glycosyltransferase family 2 protein, partial [Pyrinomonadaceae bacterium]|nr:glycosyltransferase family 2 protein [Pyrinomonadaceae bacterium]